MTPALKAAIAPLLEGVSRKDLGIRAAKLSAIYRAGGTSQIVADEMDALAYLVARLPATYAATRAVLGRMMEAVPEFTPLSLSDIGAGPGTAAWATRDIWPALKSVTLIEPNPIFRAMAAQLMPDARVVAGQLDSANDRADLVTASYVLAELLDDEVGKAALRIWGATRAMLVLIEPGTPKGFARIRAARAALVASGGHVVAPCTHNKQCPLQQDDWCHFSERLARSRDHKIVKGADVPFEDERYSYVVMSRVPVDHAGRGRIIKPVLEAKPGVTLPLCDTAGLGNIFVARRDKSAFQKARKKKWGDLIFGADGS